MNKKRIGIGAILGVIISLTVVISTLFKLDSRYLKINYAEKVDERIDKVQQQSVLSLRRVQV